MKQHITLLLLLLVLACSNKQPPNLTIQRSLLMQTSITEEQTIDAGEYILYNLSITNMGKNETFNIAIETRIVEKDTGLVIQRQNEKQTINRNLHIPRSIQIPTNTPNGIYEVRETASFDNGAEETHFLINIKAQPKKNSAETNKTTTTTPTASAIIDTTPTIKQPEKPKPNNIIINITIENYTFSPQFVTISPGTTIKWINKERSSQSVTGVGFDSEPLGIDDTFSHTFYKVQHISYGSTLSPAWGEIIIKNMTVQEKDPLKEFFENN